MCGIFYDNRLPIIFTPHVNATILVGIRELRSTYCLT